MNPQPPTNPYRRHAGERTAQWLERLVNDGAPPQTVDAVRAILDSEHRAQESLQDVLEKLGVPCNSKVIDRMNLFYPQHVMLLMMNKDRNLAEKLYAWASLAPGDSTRVDFEKADIDLDGLLGRNPSIFKGFLLGVQKIIKIIQPQEVRILQNLEKELTTHLQRSEPNDPFFRSKFITLFQFLSFERKKILLMPHYPSTLEDMRRLNDMIVLRLITSMKDALKAIRDRNMAHMDIKPSNIAISVDGDFVLIDLGSTATVGQPTNTTSCHRKNPSWSSCC